MHARTDAMINGGLVAVGALGVLDNVLVHWLLGLHRAVPGENAFAVEVGLVIGGALLVGIGLGREIRARRRHNVRPSGGSR